MQNNISVQAKLGMPQYQVVLTTANHSLIADEPQSKGGANTGPTPDELVAMALSACTSITLRMYAEHKNWDLGTINVQTTMIRHEDGTQTFELIISIEHQFDEATMTRLLNVANKCRVHKTLSRGNTINSTFKI